MCLMGYSSFVDVPTTLKHAFLQYLWDKQGGAGTPYNAEVQ